MIKKMFSEHLNIYIYYIILFSFIYSAHSSNGDFLHLLFAFDGLGSGSTSAAFLLTSRIAKS